MKQTESIYSRLIGRMDYIFWTLCILRFDTISKASITYGGRENLFFGDLFGRDSLVPRQSKYP
jgi:hypothetical protein